MKFQNATASYEQTGAAEGNPYGKWAVAAAIDRDEKGKNWGWAIMEKVGQPQVAIFETLGEIQADDATGVTVILSQNSDVPQHTIGRFRISTTTARGPFQIDRILPVPINSVLEITAEKRTETQRAELAAYYRSVAPSLEPTRKQLAELESEQKKLDAKIPRTLVTASVQPRMVRILRRGNWMDESGEVVTPAFPEILSKTAPSNEARLSRLDLANWLMAPDNPLTARVFTNRIWKLLLGPDFHVESMIWEHRAIRPVIHCYSIICRGISLSRNGTLSN